MSSCTPSACAWSATCSAPARARSPVRQGGRLAALRGQRARRTARYRWMAGFAGAAAPGRPDCAHTSRKPSGSGLGAARDRPSRRGAARRCRAQIFHGPRRGCPICRGHRTRRLPSLSSPGACGAARLSEQGHTNMWSSVKERSAQVGALLGRGAPVWAARPKSPRPTQK